MEDYGMIKMPDGRQIYFHRNSVLDGAYDKLIEGSEVRFVEEAGDEGPQASTVILIGKHHIVG
jgi:cold shock CspA family protein